mmetsp:Transcript_32523/g.127540  ORF Transcript_32523/g.127540 Transcript_32523/m.127540 type:complete len:150 (-) Transcript_32523:3797-4246(-)
MAAMHAHGECLRCCVSDVGPLFDSILWACRRSGGCQGLSLAACLLWVIARLLNFANAHGFLCEALPSREIVKLRALVPFESMDLPWVMRVPKIVLRLTASLQRLGGFLGWVSKAPTSWKAAHMRDYLSWVYYPQEDGNQEESITGFGLL